MATSYDDIKRESKRRLAHVNNNQQMVIHHVANAISMIDASNIARQYGDIGSADSALSKARDLLCQAIGIIPEKVTP